MSSPYRSPESEPQEFISDRSHLPSFAMAYSMMPIFVGMQLLFGILASVLWILLSGEQPELELSIDALVFILIFTTIVTYIAILSISWRYFNWARAQLLVLNHLGHVATAVVAGIVMAGLVIFLTEAFPPPPDMNDLTMQRLIDAGGFAVVAAFFLAVIIAPIFEEYVFRGYIFDGLSQRLPSTAVIVVCAVLFTIPHLFEYYQYWVAYTAVFSLGCIAGWLRFRSESLIPPIACHFAYNAVLMVLSL